MAGKTIFCQKSIAIFTILQQNSYPMKLHSIALQTAVEIGLPSRIHSKVQACLEEEEAYAADELVELAEEILNQLAASAISHYIRYSPQKDVYNDFLIQLFNSSGHDYNAGPIFRWAANMVRECPIMGESTKLGFYWEVKNGKDVLCDRVHHLAELRNQVMHGFFVLPPERNRKEAEEIGKLLIDLFENGLFKNEAVFHFLDKDGFTGRWSIYEKSEWNKLTNETSFGKLCDRILYEQSDDFWKQESMVMREGNTIMIPESLKLFIGSQQRGAFACWVHPNDKEGSELYAVVGNWLLEQNGIRSVIYSIHSHGVSYSSSFLLNRLAAIMNDAISSPSKNKKVEDQVVALRKKCSDKVVVLINNIHLALFSQQHVTQLKNFLFDNNIIMIAIGHHYEHFDAFFNKHWKKESPAGLPNAKQKEELHYNYLRFKGPSVDKADERDDVAKLEAIFNNVIDELDKGVNVYARRFADAYDYDIEYVHEVFAMLYPFVRTARQPFEPDTVDELYGFPSIMTEVTPIYLALGRRDLKLEYQHKVLSL